MTSALAPTGGVPLPYAAAFTGGSTVGGGSSTPDFEIITSMDAATASVIAGGGSVLGGRPVEASPFFDAPMGAAVVGANAGIAALAPTAARAASGSSTAGGGGVATDAQVQAKAAEIIATVQAIASSVGGGPSVVQARAGTTAPPGMAQRGAAAARASADQIGRAPAGATTSTAGRADPAKVRDATSSAGLTAAARRGLEEAHRFALPLVSGKRSGNRASDHAHGDAIDVANIKIGAATSVQASPEMAAYAEHMRQEGKAGRLGVKYIIMDGRIASSKEDWAWRPYTYPGKSAGELAALKANNRGEYNRLQHFDHVHVSFT